MSKRSVSAVMIAVGVCAPAILIVVLRVGWAGRDEQLASPRPTEAPPSQAREVSAPRAAASAVAGDARAQPAATTVALAALSEAKLMEQLRQAHDPAIAIQLAREGNQQFPDSDFAPEREAILIHALADAGQRSEARGEAEYMVNHYPDSTWVQEIERFTGAHRHRNVRLNDAGALEYR